MTHLALKRQDEGRITTLTPVGTLDIASAPSLERAVHELCHEEEPAQVILDLSDVSFIDTAGVRAILRCRRVFEERDCGFWVMSPQASVRRILDRCGVLGALPLHA
jgi:anti-sigma B factor antagonist